MIVKVIFSHLETGSVLVNDKLDLASIVALEECGEIAGWEFVS